MIRRSRERPPPNGRYEEGRPRPAKSNSKSTNCSYFNFTYSSNFHSQSRARRKSPQKPKEERKEEQKRKRVSSTSKAKKKHATLIHQSAERKQARKLRTVTPRKRKKTSPQKPKLQRNFLQPGEEWAEKPFLKGFVARGAVDEREGEWVLWSAVDLFGNEVAVKQFNIGSACVERQDYAVKQLQLSETCPKLLNSYSDEYSQWRVYQMFDNTLEGLLFDGACLAERYFQFCSRNQTTKLVKDLAKQIKVAHQKGLGLGEISLRSVCRCRGRFLVFDLSNCHRLDKQCPASAQCLSPQLLNLYNFNNNRKHYSKLLQHTQNANRTAQDIWAVGVLLLQVMLGTSSSPFDMPTGQGRQLDLVERQLQLVYYLDGRLRHCPFGRNPKLTCLVKRCLSVHPQLRPSPEQLQSVQLE